MDNDRLRQDRGRATRAIGLHQAPPNGRPTGGRLRVCLPGVHFHDLRYTGNQFSADTGASLRELVEHMGHDGARAALICLHMSAERQRAIADQVGKNAKAALSKRGRSGTRMARKKKGTP